MKTQIENFSEIIKKIHGKTQFKVDEISYDDFNAWGYLPHTEQQVFIQYNFSKPSNRFHIAFEKSICIDTYNFIEAKNKLRLESKTYEEYMEKYEQKFFDHFYIDTIEEAISVINTF